MRGRIVRGTWAVALPLFLGASAAFADLNAGLVLYFPCDEPIVNGLVEDASAAHNDGQAFGVVQVPDGRIGGACRFEGAGPMYDPAPPAIGGIVQYIKVGASSSLDVGANGTFTLATWYYATTDGESNSQSPLIEWGGASPSESGVHLWAYTLGGQWGGNGTGANLVDVTGNDASYIISAADRPRGTWHHLAVTYDRTTGVARVYLDGQLENTRTFTATPRTSYDLYIGRRPWDGQRLKGHMDDIRVYNRALGAEEIWQLFQLQYDFITRVRYSNSPAGPGTTRTFSRGETLYVSLQRPAALNQQQGVKLTLRKINKQLLVTQSLQRQPDGSYTGAVPLSFRAGEYVVELLAGTDLEPVVHHRSTIRIND